ncbi:MAG: hypothetical protein ACRBBN_05910 [Methyloligellaceae bacterium]
MKKRNPVARAVRTRDFKPRVVESKKRKLSNKIARREMRNQLPSFL